MKVYVFFGFLFVFCACIIESLLGNKDSYDDETNDLATLNNTTATINPLSQNENDGESDAKPRQTKKQVPLSNIGMFLKFTNEKQKVAQNQSSRKDLKAEILEREWNNSKLEEDIYHPNEIVYGIAHDKPWHVEKSWSSANFSFLYKMNATSLKDKFVNKTKENTAPYFYAVLINPNYDRSLLFLMNTLLITFGIVLNVMFISIHFHEQALYNLGSVFIANMGVANVMVTCGVCGYAWILLAAQAEPTATHCQRMWTVAASAINISFLSHLIAGIELSLRMENRVYAFGKKRTTWLAVSLLTFIWILSVSATTLGFDYKLDYDFCERKRKGNLIYRIVSAVLFYIIPTCINISIYFRMLLKYLEFRNDMFFQRAFAYHDQLKLAIALFSHFISILLFWSSFAVSVVFFSDRTQSSSLYLSAWIGILFFVFGHLIYITTNKYYRRGYLACIKYCVLKRSIGGIESNRRIQNGTL